MLSYIEPVSIPRAALDPFPGTASQSSQVGSLGRVERPIGEIVQVVVVKPGDFPNELASHAGPHANQSVNQDQW